MIETLLQTTLLQEIMNACQIFPFLGCNVLTHAKEKVIHVVVNVVTVSC